MCHILFIHSSVSASFGGFHVLAVVNSASVNIGVHLSLGICSEKVFFLVIKVTSLLEEIGRIRRVKSRERNHPTSSNYERMSILIGSSSTIWQSKYWWKWSRNAFQVRFLWNTNCRFHTAYITGIRPNEYLFFLHIRPPSLTFLMSLPTSILLAYHAVFSPRHQFQTFYFPGFLNGALNSGCILQSHASQTISSESPGWPG